MALMTWIGGYLGFSPHIHAARCASGNDINQPQLITCRQKEKEANGCLIAAVPELLEACQLVMETGQNCFADILKLGHIQPKNGTAYRQAKIKAYQAITKAEGSK